MALERAASQISAIRTIKGVQNGMYPGAGSRRGQHEHGADAAGRWPVLPWHVPIARKIYSMFFCRAEASPIAIGSLRKPGALPMVLRGFAVHASHVLYRLARNGRSKPIEESHAVGLASVEPIQHMGMSAVVQRIFC